MGKRVGDSIPPPTGIVTPFALGMAFPGDKFVSGFVMSISKAARDRVSYGSQISQFVKPNRDKWATSQKSAERVLSDAERKDLNRFETVQLCDVLK